jgi:hypothetical protein
MAMTAVLWALIAIPVLGPPIDFMYFFDDIPEVAFPLHGSCVGTGVSYDPLEGLLIDRVEANGRPVETETFEQESHSPGELILSPSPSFAFRLRIHDLRSVTSEETEAGVMLRKGVSFDVKGLPKTLKISYRIRCADGTTSKSFVTRGERYPLLKSNARTHWPFSRR